MFSRPKNQRAGYQALDPSPETFIHQLYCSKEPANGYNLSLRDLLQKVCLSDRSSISAFEIQRYGTFTLVASLSSISTTNSIEDGITIALDFFDQGDSQTSFLCNAWHEKSRERQRESRSSTLLVLAKYEDRLVHRLGLLPTQSNAISTARRNLNTKIPTGGSTRTKAMYYAWALVVVATVLAIIVLVAIHVMASHRVDDFHSWRQYDTSGSIGPQYQLAVNASNATSWISYAGDPSLWTLRIDDQAIIPIRLLDNEERHCQDWIQKRYPEMNQIRLNGSYFNKTWLSSPAINRVPTDELFHFSHCILAVKRYIKAKDTGKHVCGRDIDKKHVQHCLDALDWWAFPEGRSGEDIPNSNRTFWWRTKVCFD